MESSFIYNAVYQVVLSASSSLKSCIKSTRLNFSRNPSGSFNLLFLQACAKFTLLHFSRLWFSHIYSVKWMHTQKNPDIRYCTITQSAFIQTYCKIFEVMMYGFFFILETNFTSLDFSKWSYVAGIFKALSELNTYLSLLMNICQTQWLSGIELDFHPNPLDIIVQGVKGKAQIR